MATTKALEVPQAAILVVDDNVDTLRSMAAVLESLGEQVLTAANANQALKHLLSCEPAVILLDVMMPEMDGFQLATLIRQRERFQHTPIIFLTGLGTEDRHMLQGYKAGAVDYLLKPCDPDVLRYKVRVFVELAKQRQMLSRYAQVMAENSRALEASLQATLRAKRDLEREIEQREKAERSRDRLAGQLGATPDFVEAMAEGAVTLALDGSVLYSNRRFGEMLGRNAAELVGTSIATLVPLEHQETFKALIENCSAQRVQAEIELLTAEGTTTPASISLSAFRTADIEAIALVVTDLRDQKRSEQLIAEGRLARSILEHAHSGIAVCDQRGHVLLASKPLYAMCAGNPLFRHFDELFASREFTVRQVLEGGTINTVEVTVERDRTRSSLLVSAAPIREADGTVLGCVVVLLDITSRKQIEEALQRSEKLAAAGRIAGTLAHEINNPLSAVTNVLYILLHDESLTGQTRAYLDLASNELARVSHIVRNTLSFYRESARPVPVRVSDLLDTVVDVYARDISARNIHVSREYKSGDTISGFPGELRQVLSNLVCNALESMTEGETIRMRVRACRHLGSGAQGVRITIGDRGAGIPARDQSRVFEPFFTTKGDKGTGLGLWVSHGIISKQGGAIRFRSKPGHGTVFSLFVPSAQQGSRRAPAMTADLAA